jgi:hypothetical protein
VTSVPRASIGRVSLWPPGRVFALELALYLGDSKSVEEFGAGIELFMAWDEGEHIEDLLPIAVAFAWA